MTTCTYCGGPGAPNPRVMCSACIDRFMAATASPPLSEESAAKLNKFLEDTMPRSKDAIMIYDDLEADCPVEPGMREKMLEHYDSIMATVPPGAVQVFVCGPSTSPCGPNRDDHVWDDEVEFTDSAGKNCGGSVACSRCGLPAMDYDIWNAP
ncbi:hypothetical protein LCGC14_0259150 [marine sediment metagenome]|uniref:Uncharacterized protein n=1 Tax=marine sediment metagenome TaxID=412755 RepID=A0A0F9U2I8_9ZZZZ